MTWTRSSLLQKAPNSTPPICSMAVLMLSSRLMVWLVLGRDEGKRMGDQPLKIGSN